jgi:hypothetical protein
MAYRNEGIAPERFLVYWWVAAEITTGR